MGAKNNDKVKFALMYANHKNWGNNHPARANEPMHPDMTCIVDEKTFIEATNYCIEKYFSHPSYWKIDGKLYFSFYELSTLIKSLGGMEIDIEFVPEVVLDEKYNFGFNSSFDELTSVGSFFIGEYRKIIDMKKPIISVYEGDYNIYGKQLYNMFLYEGSGSLTDRIINYHFNRVYFHPDDYGRLCRIRIEKTDLSHKVGDYPIISLEDAKELLFDGKYITTVPYILTDKDKVAKAELVYRNGGTEKYYMPYYKFFIELPNENLKNGLKDFGVYYVPAVESKYISNMPVWDGSFN
jgi:hypothetical protein